MSASNLQDKKLGYLIDCRNVILPVGNYLDAIVGAAEEEGPYG